MGHALVRPVLDRLVLKSASGMGYPAKGGTALKDWAGKTVPLKADDEWSIAHPLDFAAAGDWHECQADCFRAVDAPRHVLVTTIVRQACAASSLLLAGRPAETYRTRSVSSRAVPQDWNAR